MELFKQHAGEQELQKLAVHVNKGVNELAEQALDVLERDRSNEDEEEEVEMTHSEGVIQF